MSEGEQGQAEPKDALKTTAALRMPVFEKDTPVREKIDSLEEYMLLSAFWEGQCVEAKNAAEDELQGVEEEWEAIEPDGFFLNKQQTEKQVERDRRRDSPDLWRRRRDLQTLVRRLAEQIARMEREAKRTSRVYTFLTGA